MPRVLPIDLVGYMGYAIEKQIFPDRSQWETFRKQIGGYVYVQIMGSIE